MKTKLILPFPPSTNTLYRTTKSGGIYKTKEHGVYFNAVHSIIQGKKIKPTQEDVELTICLFRPAKRGDIDGPLKTLFDALEQPTALVPVSGSKKKKRVVTSKYGLYVNDSQVTDLHIYKRDDKDNPRVEVLMTVI